MSDCCKCECHKPEKEVKKWWEVAYNSGEYKLDYLPPKSHAINLYQREAKAIIEEVIGEINKLKGHWEAGAVNAELLIEALRRRL